MLDLDRQIALKTLVSPETRVHLAHEGGNLRTVDGRHVYPVVSGVPILFTDPSRITAALEAHNGAMVREYEAPPPGPPCATSISGLRIPTKPATRSDRSRPPCRSAATSKAHG